MTIEGKRRAFLSQPSAMKEVYRPDGHYVNGHVIVRGSDAWHVFYGPGLGGHNFDKKHATSEDLVTWTTQEPVLLPGGPGDCDGGEISVASVIEHGGRWHMVYQARPTRTASRRLSSDTRLFVRQKSWAVMVSYPGDLQTRLRS